MYNQEIGKKGEEIAATYFKKIGYNIIERNFSCWFGEIDIIAVDKNEIVFIEVKTRTNAKYGAPSEAVNKIKQKHLKKATEYYIFKNNLAQEYIRFDIIEIASKGNSYTINHIKQALE